MPLPTATKRAMPATMEHTCFDFSSISLFASVSTIIGANAITATMTPNSVRTQ